jgi:tripartite-type tricarboxylate transporter receptor subunit TctC
MMTSLPPVAQFLKTGALRAIAVTSPTRMPAMPDLPAISETLPGFQFFIVNGFWGPARLPNPIVQRLFREIGQIVEQTDFREKLERLGLQAKCESGRELHELVATSANRFALIAQASTALDR